MNRKIFGFVLDLLFRHYKCVKLRNLLFQKRTFHLRLQHFKGQGCVYLSPLNLCSLGLLQGQIVYVYLSYETSQGVIKNAERLFVVRSLPFLGLNEFLLGDCDRANLFGYRDVVKYATIDVIRQLPFSPLSYIKLTKPDSVRLAPIRQISVKGHNPMGPALMNLLNEPRIIYRHDVVALYSENALSGEGTIRTVRIEFNGDSPCILDSSCSFYETATSSAPIPNGGQAAPRFNLPKCLTAVLQRMRNIYFAYKKNNDQPLVYLLSGSAGSGKRLVVERFAALTHQNLHEVSCFEIWSEVPGQVEQKLKHAVDKAKSYQPCVLHLTFVDILGYDPNGTEPDHRVLSTLQNLLADKANITVILSCTSDHFINLSSAIRSLALYDFSIPFLDENSRFALLSQQLPEEDALFCSRNTSGFSLAELFSLVEDVRRPHKDQTASTVSLIEKAIDKRNAEFADSIGAPKIPSVSWDDVGGLEDTKQIVIESIEASLHGNDSLRRSGIILFGPPGCGKTLIAKAVATEFKIAFLSVKGPELLNKYVGQSEENLRKVFERARQASPCVIFFDEMDSLAPNRGRSGDSGGVMDRIVSQLLSEMDTLLSDPQSKVFLMAATNRADLLDPSLLTAGRFDQQVNVAPGSSVETKTKILEAVCRRVKLHNDVNLTEIAESCPSVMSGAELYSVVSTATMAALREEVKKVDDGKIKMADAQVSIARRHLLSAVEEVRKRTDLR